MGLLDELLGNGPLRRTYEDFVSRYNQGHPAEGYSDKEVVDRYREVAHKVPRDEYAQAATDALSKLSPQERAEFVEMLQERARARGVTLPSQVGADPGELGQVVTDLHEKPGQLTDILGGGSLSSQQAGAGAGTNALSNVLASPLAKAALAGIAAMITRRVMQGSPRQP